MARYTSRNDDQMQLQHLQATVKDVVDCLQDVQRQVEMLRQHILYFRSQEEKQTLQDAEIQTLKGAVQTLQGRRRGTTAQHKAEFLKIRLLVRELDAQKAEILQMQQAELQELREKLESLKQFGVSVAADGKGKGPSKFEQRSPGARGGQVYGMAMSSAKAAVAQALAVHVEGVTSMEVLREELLDSVFRALDEDHSGALNSKELRVFAMTGWPDYNYDDHTWAVEYQEEVLENGWKADIGCEKKGFIELVNDIDSDYYCTDAALTKIAAKLLLMPDEETEQDATGAASDASDVQDAAGLDTTLLQAIESGEESFAVAVVARSNMAQVNEMDNNGFSALHNAAQLGQVQVCRSLLAREDFDYTNAKDWTFGATALHIAAQYGRVEICNTLLEAPRFAEADSRNCDGATALHIAARHGHAEVCQALLDKSEFAESGAQDFNGYTALHVAAINAQAEVCRVLVAHRRFQSQDAKSILGTTAFDIAQGEARLTLHRCLNPHLATAGGTQDTSITDDSKLPDVGGMGSIPFSAASHATSAFTVGKKRASPKAVAGGAAAGPTSTTRPSEDVEQDASNKAAGSDAARPMAATQKLESTRVGGAAKTRQSAATKPAELLKQKTMGPAADDGAGSVDEA